MKPSAAWAPMERRVLACKTQASIWDATARRWRVPVKELARYRPRAGPAGQHSAPWPRARAPRRPTCIPPANLTTSVMSAAGSSTPQKASNAAPPGPGKAWQVPAATRGAAVARHTSAAKGMVRGDRMNHLGGGGVGRGKRCAVGVGVLEAQTVQALRHVQSDTSGAARWRLPSRGDESAAAPALARPMEAAQHHWIGPDRIAKDRIGYKARAHMPGTSPSLRLSMKVSHAVPGGVRAGRSRRATTCQAEKGEGVWHQVCVCV